MNKKSGMEIRAARRAAHLTLPQVAGPLGRTGEWLRRVEIGTLPVSPDVRVMILNAIEKLSAINAAYEKQVSDLARRAARDVGDLRIPRKEARELAGGKR